MTSEGFENSWSAGIYVMPMPMKGSPATLPQLADNWETAWELADKLTQASGSKYGAYELRCLKPEVWDRMISPVA